MFGTREERHVEQDLTRRDATPVGAGGLGLHFASVGRVARVRGDREKFKEYAKEVNHDGSSFASNALI